MNRLLEVCVDSLASARAAIRGGADRLELCSALAVGGLTPYGELLQQIRSESDIAIRCLIRPRGGDFLYTKEEIATMYLNTVEYGSNAYGIKSAAQTFFGKEPHQLAVQEAAMLVGVVNAPTRYSPVRNPENALNRRNLVLQRMRVAGALTREECDSISALPIVLNYKPMALCVMYCFISTFVGNFMLKTTKTAYEFTVITTHKEEIVEEIFTKLHHGCTEIDAIGTYTGAKKSVLICIINKHQIAKLRSIIASYPGSFANVTQASEIFGNFKNVK